MRWETFELFIGGTYELHDAEVTRLLRSTVEGLPEETDFPIFDLVESPQGTVAAAVFPGPRLELDAAKLRRYPPEVSHGVLAHELAHLHLAHDLEHYADLSQEWEADGQARRWGFGAEIDAMRVEIGPPTLKPDELA